MMRLKTRLWVAIAILVLMQVQSQLWSPAEAANILAVQTVPGRSHWNMMSAVLRALTDRGHNVTVFTPLLDGRRENYTEVDISDVLRLKTSQSFTYTTKAIDTTSALITIMMNATRTFCDVIHEHPRIKEILIGARPFDFDVVITEPTASECVAYMATVLRVPMVYVVPPAVVTYLERSLFGHIPNPATVPHALYQHGIPKTFVDRLANTVLTVYCSFLVWYYEWHQATFDPRPYDRIDLVKPSVTFVNSHFITDPSRPLPPDVIQIGGIHLVPPKEIPKDILEFIEDSPHGVIYFSFGSILSMSTIPENIQKVFKEVFKKVPQRVLWKYESDEMEDKPYNLMTRKWFPQRDILLHPKVKLFISHGGISGVYEAVDAGVPVLGFPIFYDQQRNLNGLVDAGMAISIDLFSLTNDTFLNAILELINDKSYQRNANMASELFKDRPISTAKSVVYWTEYVLRHKGAPHLKSHAINLPWYQYFLIDVIGICLFIVIIISVVTYYGLKTIYKYTFEYYLQKGDIKLE